MDSFGWLLLIILIVLFFWKTVHPTQLPPGPRPLPFLGNLLQLNIHNPMKDFKKFAQKYGPIYTLYIGQKPWVFVHGFSLVKEVLLTKGTEFAGRPDVAVLNVIAKKKGIITAPYGKAWKEQRRFSLMSLKHFGLGKRSMEERILEEVTYLLQVFEENMNAPFDALSFLESAVANIISSILLGKQFKYGDDALREMMDMVHDTTKLLLGPWAHLYEALPIVRGLPLPHRNLFKTADNIIAFFSKEIEEHRTTFVPGHHRDITDAFLEEVLKHLNSPAYQRLGAKHSEPGQHLEPPKPENKDSSFEEHYIIISLAELFAAGLETTATTLGWSLLYMMAFPKVQEKCQEEINNVFGNNPCIKYEDRDKLPYTNAVIHETQRFANVLPMGIYHAPLKDMQLSGYTIPKDTTVVTSLLSVHFDESQWKYPHEFNPANFLNEKGEFEKPEAFMAFSAGPRGCLGENLARMELFLFITNILRRFQIQWPDETKAPDLNPGFGLTQSPPCFKVALKFHQPNMNSTKWD